MFDESTWSALDGSDLTILHPAAKFLGNVVLRIFLASFR
jgi:hypothetical protein